MFDTSKILVLSLSMLVSCLSLRTDAAQPLGLQQAIGLAQSNDPWLHASKLNQHAIEIESVAASALPDPKVSISMANLPTDSWDINQEPMTQFKVGMSQMLPRGDELAIKQSQLKIDASKHPLLREDRKAKLSAQVAQQWLDAFLAQQTIALINKDKELFVQLVDAVKASYASTSGNTRQQDVIRAQLELVQLDDRLTLQYQALDTAIANLNPWLFEYNNRATSNGLNIDGSPIFLSVEKQLPQIALQHGEQLNRAHFSRAMLAKLVANHPAIKAIDIEEQVARKGVELAHQQYKPQWQLNASYALRDDTPMGENRADFFSVGVTFDMPLFSRNRQDKLVSASISQSEAIKTQKLLKLKNTITEIEKELKNLQRLSQREALYQSQLLNQTYQQAEAAVTAYTNDDGNFAEVVRSRISELNTRITALSIQVDKLKTITRINYFLTQSSDQSSHYNGKNHDFN